MKVAVYVNVKNEDRLVEFIDYYKHIGVDYFIIMDDDSVYDAKKLLLDGNIDEKIFDVLYTNGRNFLWGVYNSKNHWDNEIIPLLTKNDIDYVFHADADEFLYLGKFKNISEVIEYYSPFDSLRINWLLFGSNNVEKNETKSIIFTFNKSDTHLTQYIKSITRVSSISTDSNEGFCPNPHFLNVRNGGIVKNILNETIEKGYNCIKHQLDLIKSEAPIYLAHYIMQDVRTYINRKIYLPIFLMISQKFTLTPSMIENIKKNEDEMIKFLIMDLNINRDEKIDHIHSLTELPKPILSFLNGHFAFMNKNIIENNDIIDLYNKIKINNGKEEANEKT